MLLLFSGLWPNSRVPPSAQTGSQESTRGIWQLCQGAYERRSHETALWWRTTKYPTGKQIQMYSEWNNL